MILENHRFPASQVARLLGVSLAAVLRSRERGRLLLEERGVDLDRLLAKRK